MNKEEKIGIIIIFIILSITGLIILKIVNNIQDKKIQFEYALDGQIYKSKNCYLKEDLCYCEYEDKMIQVDNYYEVVN